MKLFSDHLKPVAAEERRIEEEEKKAREEQERIAKQLAEGSLIGLVQIFSASWSHVTMTDAQIQIRVISGNNKGLILLSWWMQSSQVEQFFVVFNSWDTYARKQFWNYANHIFSQQSK